MDTHQTKRNRESGFTIIEVMVAAMLLVTGVLGTVTLIDGANALSNSTKAREGGVNLAREIIEVSRSLEYEDLNTTDLLPTLQAQPGLNDDDLSQAGWQIDRRAGTGAGAIRYVVEVFTCVMDDAKDGARASGGGFCNGSAAAGTCTTTPCRVDNNPDDLRRVEVNVKYTRPGRPTPSCVGAGGADTGTGADCINQATLVPNPSGGLGPSVRNSTVVVSQCTGASAAEPCTVLDPGDPVEPPATGVKVTFETSQAADQVNWSVNNTEGSAGVTGDGTVTNDDSTFRRFTIRWAFPNTLVDDRAYQMTIQGFLLSASGPPGSAAIPVNLNRPAPPDVENIDPQSFGFSTRLPGTGAQNPPGVTDLLWATGDGANDINNYQVFRTEAAGAGEGPKLNPGDPDVFVTDCGPPDLIQTDLSCFDPSPPWATPGPTGVYNYYVVALDSPWQTQANANFDCPWSTLDGSASGTVTVNPSIFPAGTRPGCPSKLVSVDLDALAANEPRPTLTGVPVVTTVSGAPHLDWTGSVAADPNGGTISFYRVYRASSNLTDPPYSARYGTTNGLVTQFDDESPATGPNFYWVTAVDEQLQESDPIGPVSWP